MSLYYEAANLISTSDKDQGSLKSRVFAAKHLKSTPTQLFALVSEATKWSPVLKEVIERSYLLAHERKLTPSLALLLVHDLLLAKKGIAAPAAHALRTAVERHKARLHAEFTKTRLRRGCASIDALRSYVEEVKGGTVQNAITDHDGGGNGSNGVQHWAHPRWARINRLKTTLEEQLETTFAGYRRLVTLKEVLEAKASASPSLVLHVDAHIPDLIALPAYTDLSTTIAYLDGKLILQDKASCFPAYLLDPDGGDILDACAAPGNKSTHLASLAHTTWSDANNRPKIWACERDKARAKTLEKMIMVAGACDLVQVSGGEDFLRLDPQADPWCNVGALLLDPSCSGSGMIGRDERPMIQLPSRDGDAAEPKTSRKRKRKTAPVTTSSLPEVSEDEVLSADSNFAKGSSLTVRLAGLSAFQIKLLLHAMTFPNARKLVYSTCSVHDEENEKVVLAALASSTAKALGWRIQRRHEQVEGLKAWKIRGNVMPTGSSETSLEVAKACIRCEKNTEEGTQGFFVAGFVREAGTANRQEEDKEEEGWEGFDE